MYKNIAAGKNAPNDINVIIEIPMNSSDSIKYEFDKESGMICVDRFMQTPMYYPANYGFIANTLGGDGDPLDCLVITRHPLMAGSMINVKPIGVLFMEDESGMDEKIIAVPFPKMDKFYEGIDDISNLKTIELDRIKHFFERYKDLEAGKWVKILGYADATKAKEIIQNSLLQK